MKFTNILFGLLFLLSHSAHASLVLDSQHTAVTPASGGFYGTAVAMDASGMWMAVGQPGPAATSAGQVEIYRYSAGAWSFVQTITATNAEVGDAFGTSLSFAGTVSMTAGGRLLVGAPLEDGDATSTATTPNNFAVDAGAVYVFELNTTSGQWEQVAYIKASDAAAGAQFGWSVDMDLSRLVVGADARAAGATVAAGAVYVFEETTAGTWTEQAILTAGTAVANAELGESVVIDGDTIAAAAYKDDVNATTAAGRVYVWVFDPVAGTWGLEATLSAQTPSTNARYGSGLALEGDRLVIGAKWADPATGVDAGEVEFWTRSAGVWNRQQVLQGAVAGDEFGSSVALQGSLMMVGAPASLPGTTTAGAAYVYALNGTAWVQKALIDAASGSFNTAGDALGSSVATGAGWLVAGAPTVDVGVPAVASAGAVQVAQLVDDVAVTVTETLTPVNATDGVSFTIDVIVPAGATVTEIQLDTVETNLSGVTYTGACTAMPCVLANPTGGSTLTVNVSATVTAGGAYDLAANIVTPYSIDPNAANDTANAGGMVNPAADVNTAVTLTTAGTVNATGTVSYTVVVNNAGPDAASNVVVTPTLTNLTLVSASSTNCTTLPCTLTTLAVGASETITVTATVNNGGAFDLAIDSNGAEFDPNTGNNGANAVGTANPVADVAVSITLDTPGPYVGLQTVQYTITVSNAGPDTASNVALTLVPDRLTGLVLSGACTSQPCVLTSLANGASASVVVAAQLPFSGSFGLSVSGSAGTADLITANNAAAAPARRAAAAYPVPTLNGTARGLMISLLLLMGLSFIQRTRRMS